MKIFFTLLFFVLCANLGVAQQEDCLAPKNFKVDVTNKDGLVVHFVFTFDSVPEVDYYLVSLRKNNDTTWYSHYIQYSNFTFTNLPYSSKYDVCIRSICKSGERSTDNCLFLTIPCPDTTPPVISGIENGRDFCITDKNDYQLSGIPEGGTFSGAGVINNTFNASKAGIGEHTITYIPKICNLTTSITVKVLNQSTSQITGINNGTKFCYTNNSMIVLVGTPTGGSFFLNDVPIGSAIVPSTFGLGNYIITYVPKQSSCAISSKISFSIVQEVGCVSENSCASPINIKSQLYQSRTSTNITWGKVQGANTYQVSYREVNTNLRTTQTTVNNSFVIQNLKPIAKYEFRIRTNCSNQKTSDWSSIVLISSPESDCQTPTSIKISNITQTNAVVSWNSVGNVKKYYVLLRKAGGSEISFVTTNLSITLRNLTPSTTYSYKVRAMCEDGKLTPLSPSQNFKTL